MKKIFALFLLGAGLLFGSCSRFQSSGGGAAAQVVVQEGHNGSVWQLSFSADGKYLLSADSDCVKIWEYQSGRLLRTLMKRHSDERDSDISPDGSLCAFINSDGAVELCSLWTGESEVLDSELYAEFEHYYVQFAPDGSYLAVSDFLNVRVYDVKTRKRLGVFSFDEYQQFTDMRFIPGTSAVALLASPFPKEGHTLDRLLIMSVTGLGITKVFDLGSYTRGIAVSPDGSCIATVNKDGEVVLVDLTTWELDRELSVDPPARQVMFSQGGRRLFVFSDGSDTLGVYDLKKRRKLPFAGHSSAEIVAFSPNKKEYVVGCWNKIEVRSSATGELVRTIAGTSDFQNVQFFPQHDMIFVSSGMFYENCLLFDSDFNDVTALMKKTGGSYGHSLSDFDILECDKAAMEGETWAVYASRLDSDSTREKLFDIQEFSGGPTLIQGSGSPYIGLRKDHNVFVYKRDGEFVGTYETDGDYYSTGEYVSPAGTYLVSDTFFGTSYILNLETHEILTTQGFNIVFSPDDRYAAMSDNDEAGSIVVYDTATWQIVKTFQGYGKSCFSNTGAYFLTWDNDFVNVYDFAAEKRLRRVRTGSGSGQDLLFTADDSKFVLLNYSKVLRCYSVDTGELLLSVVGDMERNWLSYTPSGTATGSAGEKKRFVYDGRTASK